MLDFVSRNRLVVPLSHNPSSAATHLNAASSSPEAASSSLERLEGKVAVIAGGASGIGECTARLFSLHGAKVVIADIQDDRGRCVCSDIGPSSASFVHCDVTNASDVQNAVETAVSKYGKLDIMFNNAGAIDPYRSIVDTDQPDFDRVLRVVVTGTFLGIKHAARVMIPNAQGSIISTSSIAGVGGGMGTHAYTSAKHAVVGLTKNAAVELGQFGIRVNCVSPYATATPLAMNAMGFADTEEAKFERAVSMCGNLKGTILKKEDVAGAVMYLGSDEAKYVSGHNLVVDGGYTVVNTGLNRVNDFR